MFQDSDDDKDGRLTKVEILSHHDLWVGSAAAELPTHDPAEL